MTTPAEPSVPPDLDPAPPLTLTTTLSHKRPATTPAFLEKLFDILEDSSLSELIAWEPAGTSFTIKRVGEFSEAVLPRFFKHNNIQSYIRQLNMYGFAKTRHDAHHHEFAHRLFLRGRRDLLVCIRRKTQSTQLGGASSATTAQTAARGAVRGGAVRDVEQDEFSHHTVQHESSQQRKRPLRGCESPAPLVGHSHSALTQRVSQLESALSRLATQHNALCEAVQRALSTRTHNNENDDDVWKRVRFESSLSFSETTTTTLSERETDTERDSVVCAVKSECVTTTSPPHTQDEDMALSLLTAPGAGSALCARSYTLDSGLDAIADAAAFIEREQERESDALFALTQRSAGGLLTRSVSHGFC